MLDGAGLDDIYARVVSGTTTSYLADGLGSTLGLTNAAGATTATYSYEPYGAVSKTGTDDTTFQFTGRENDGASNLYYYRARYYSAQFGRFISTDPMGLIAGPNNYAYANGNPISNIDPLGLWTGQFGFAGSYAVTIAGIGIAGTAGFGVAIDGHGNIAVYGYRGPGGAVGTPGLSGGVQVAESNGNTICDLTGPFKNASLGGGWGPDAIGDAFWGTGTQGQSVQGAGLTLGAGLGVTGFSGQTTTTIGSIGQLW